jgi:hypothetical protein
MASLKDQLIADSKLLFTSYFNHRYPWEMPRLETREDWMNLGFKRASTQFKDLLTEASQRVMMPESHTTLDWLRFEVLRLEKELERERKNSPNPSPELP